MIDKDQSCANSSIRKYTIAAIGTVLLLVVGGGIWAVMAKLSGAVIGVGIVVVEGNIKRIQHREGGIVGEILVRDGSKVKAGELLIKLDDTITRANLAIISKQIQQLQARKLRLLAERNEDAEMMLSISTNEMEIGQQNGEYIQAEKALFLARKNTLKGQKDQLSQRIDQISQETEGLILRRDAKKEELMWIAEELKRVKMLSDQELIQFSRLSELQRVNAQLVGERGQLISEIARAATRVTETNLQILQLEQDRRAEVLTELRDVDNKLNELSEQYIAANDELRRINILSPQNGVVHELTVHTVGGVISPGETVMQIVPMNDNFIVEARIQPNDIDQLHVGQVAALRFSAFNQRTTPEINGVVNTVTAALIQNPQTGEAWYTAKIIISENEIARLGGLPLMAGMPVEAFIQTGDRNALSYLVKPLSDQIQRALRED